MTEQESAQFVMMEIRTRFQWPLPSGQSYDWVRSVKLCKDMAQAKRLVLRLADEGKLSVPAFRALLSAETPWSTAGPEPVDYAQFKGAAGKLREQVVASGDARMQAVLDNVDQVRASKPMAWRPLSEEQQQVRKQRIIAQLHASQAVEARPTTTFDPPSPMDE